MKIKTRQFGSGVPDANRRLNEGIGDRVFTQHIDFGEELPEVPENWNVTHRNLLADQLRLQPIESQLDILFLFRKCRGFDQDFRFRTFP